MFRLSLDKGWENFDLFRELGAGVEGHDLTFEIGALELPGVVARLSALGARELQTDSLSPGVIAVHVPSPGFPSGKGLCPQCRGYGYVPPPEPGR